MIPALYRIQSTLTKMTAAIEAVNRLAESNGRELVSVYELMNVQQDVINAQADRIAALEARLAPLHGEN